MIAFVLHHAGMKAFRLALEAITGGIETPVANALVTGNETAQTEPANRTAGEFESLLQTGMASFE